MSAPAKIPATTENVATLAVMFASCLADEVGAERLPYIDANDESPDDYTDANLTISRAFALAFGREPVMPSHFEDIPDDDAEPWAAVQSEDLRLINDAWGTCRSEGFAPRVRTLTDAESAILDSLDAHWDANSSGLWESKP